MIDDVKHTNSKYRILTFIENVILTEILKMSRDDVYISKPTFSPLLNTFLTSVCTNYQHPHFKNVKNGMLQTVSTCIDIDVNKFFKIKKD
jgi:hypothetical protein